MRVFKMNDYEWYVSPLGVKETVAWYNNEFDDDTTSSDILEYSLDTEGMWFLTNDPNDIERLGDSDELIHYIQTDKGRKRSVQIGDLMQRYNEVYKFTSFREVIDKENLWDITQPELIASTDW